MAKYLVITDTKDFISNSRNAKQHLKTTDSYWCVIYDKNGLWVSGAEIKRGKLKQTNVNSLSDGVPRLQYATIIRQFPVGTKWKDVAGFIREQLLKIGKRLTEGLEYNEQQLARIYDWLFDQVSEGKTIEEIGDMCRKNSDTILNEIF